MYKIGDVSQLTGLSIRALHHFDEIGLLIPAHRDPSGYRRYNRENLLRLQHILVLRELGMPLSEIHKALQNGPQPDLNALKSHRQNLMERRASLDKLLQTLTKTINTMENNTLVTEAELFEGFSKHEIDAINAEVDATWDPATVAESRRRTASFTKAQWNSVKAHGTDVEQNLAASMHLPADSDAVQALVKQHHAWIEHFYPCTKAMYLGLASLYLEDERFTAHYERIKPGLAAFLSNAMVVFANKNLS
jgi:DNA-binding transcriptional MerR regulator